MLNLEEEFTVQRRERSVFFQNSPSECTVNHFTAPNLQRIKTGKDFFQLRWLRSHYQFATIYLMIFNLLYICFIFSNFITLSCINKMQLNSVVLFAICWLNTSLANHSPSVPVCHTQSSYIHTYREPQTSMKASTTHWRLWYLQTKKHSLHLINFTDRTWKLSQTIKHRMSPSMDCKHLNTSRIIGLSHSSPVTQRDWSRSLIKSLQLHKNTIKNTAGTVEETEEMKHWGNSQAYFLHPL